MIPHACPKDPIYGVTQEISLHLLPWLQTEVGDVPVCASNLQVHMLRN